MAYLYKMKLMIQVYIAGRNDVKLEQISDPSSILIFSLLAFDGADIFGICVTTSVFPKNVENRDPVLPR